MPNPSLTVVAGLHSQRQSTSQEIQRKQVVNMVIHEGYDEYSNQNDIALIRLASPVTLNSYVNIACLPGQDPVLNSNVMIGM
jgi:secreted trypsin-like serine protease